MNIKLRTLRLLLLVSGMTCVTILYGQIAGFNYVPFELVDTDVDWHHVSYDSTIVNLEIEGSPATYDGYSHLRPHYDECPLRLIDDGYLYLIHLSRYDQDVTGALIEKIDIDSGELLWNIIFDYRSTEIREFVFRAKIDGDVLTLYNLEIINEYPVPLNVPIIALGWAEGYLKIRKYDTNTGILITETFPDTTQNLKVINNHTFNETLMSVVDDEVIEIYDHEWLESGPVIIIDSINHRGEYINPSDTLRSQLGNLDWVNSWRVNGQLMYRDQPNERLLWLDYYTKQPWSADSTRANINVYEDDHVEILNIDFPNKAQMKTWAIWDVVDDKILLKLLFLDDSSSYLLMNLDGEIIWKVDIPNEQVRNHIKVNAKGEFVMVNRLQPNTEQSKIDILQYKDQTLSIKGNVVLKNENYYMYPLEIQKLEDNDYLISVVYQQDTLPASIRGEHRTIFKVAGNEIGLSTSVDTDEVPTSDIRFNTYPNPFTQSIYVESVEEGALVSLITQDGRKLGSSTIFNGIAKISCPTLSSGTYYIMLTMDNYSITTPVIKL